LDVTYQSEIIHRELISEMSLLLIDHWNEANDDMDEIDVDWPMYQSLQKQGSYYLFTIRAESELIGYAGYMIIPSLQCRKRLQAVGDMIYVKPEYRGKMLAIKLMKFAENKMKEVGANAISQSIKAHHDFSAMMRRLGYKLEEYYFTKRI